MTNPADHDPFTCKECVRYDNRRHPTPPAVAERTFPVLIAVAVVSVLAFVATVIVLVVTQ